MGQIVAHGVGFDVGMLMEPMLVGYAGGHHGYGDEYDRWICDGQEV